MKHSIVFKFLAILLATVFLLTAVASGIAIVALIGLNLYDSTPSEELEHQMYSERQNLAVNLVYTYATLELGEIPELYFQQYYGYDWKDADLREGCYHYAIYNDLGVMVESTMPENVPEEEIYEIELHSIGYRRLMPLGYGTHSDDYFDEINNRYVEISYEIRYADSYTVQLYVLDGAYTQGATWQFVEALYAVRYQLFAVLGIALLLFVVMVVYLCCAAGRNSRTEGIRPGGLNRLPLDIYTPAVAVLMVALVQLAVDLMQELAEDMTALMICLLILMGTVGCLAIVALIYAWAAQLKAPNGYWRKNSIIGRVLRLLGWLLNKIGNGFRWCFRALYSLIRLMPVMWQGLIVWLIAPLILAFCAIFFFALFAAYIDWYPFWGVVCLLVSIWCTGAFLALPIYCAYCSAILAKGVRRMSRGDLNTKISTKYLLGSFRDFALHLNTLSDTISLAAEQQLRSERMKTELITNVSHDIKTPLTSIINFVDLLEKPHTPEQEKEYLEVLSRQSGQMKKLIEDLMELSKASSGNLTVNPQKMDAAEAVNQALGEFSDKLDAAGLTPVFRQPEQPVWIHADGRHVWRVLFNLLTNAVKYALPGTRLYVDLMTAGDNVVLSLKNVSKAELNISADELMERFVQGDASRKSEGSGLGLNIAKSLMEVQGGELQLLLDGDLFKVTLIFPGA